MLRKFLVPLGIFGLTALGTLLCIGIVFFATTKVVGHFPGERDFMSSVAATVYAVEVLIVGALLGLSLGYTGAMLAFKQGALRDLVINNMLTGGLGCLMSLLFSVYWRDMQLWISCLSFSLLVLGASILVLVVTKPRPHSAK